MGVTTTASPTEHAGSAPGWSIGNDRQFYDSVNSVWTTISSGPHLIEVKGEQHDEITVPVGWALTPSDLTTGKKFRLIFLTGTNSRSPNSSDIEKYNTYVQGQANSSNAHSAIKPYHTYFRVLASTSAVHARDNTHTTSSDTDAAIYWLGGNKVADNYGDLYDGTWDDEENAKNRSGSDSPTGTNFRQPYTGSDNGGRKHTDPLGNSGGFAVVGKLDSSDGNPLSSSELVGTGQGQLRPYYALSGVFVVPSSNSAPEFGADTDTRTFPENSGTGTNVGGPVAATDVDNDTLTYSLTGNSRFQIISTTGQITTASGQSWDYEGIRNFQVTVNVSDSKDVAGDADTVIDDTIAVTISLTNVGGPVAATDVDNDTLTYSLTGNSRFQIISTTGQITTASGQSWDYEGIRNFQVTVNVSDSKDVAGDADTVIDDTIAVTISLTNVNEAPEITSPPATRSVPENSTAVHTFAASDVDASDTKTWSVETADDGGKFEISSTGALSFKNAPDFEMPTDVGDTAMNNTYVVAVKVTDAGGLTDTHTVTVTVTNVNEAPEITLSPTTLTVAEGSTADYTVQLNVQPTADVTISITGGGDVSVSPTSLTFTSATWDTAQTVTVTAAQDDDAADDTQTVSHAVDAGSADEYLGASLDGLTVTVNDDESLGITLSPTTLTVNEGSTADYTVKLSVVPTADVTINITGGGDVSVSPTTLTFTSATWNTAQTVTVTAAQDDDGADDAQTVGHAVASTSAAEYIGATLDGLPVTVTDDDTEVTVPHDWSLIPTGLTAGDKFRLIFLTNTGHLPTSTDIADYNTYVQGQAASGHDDIQDYSSWFRVLGSTATTAARDNTETTYTATKKGFPIYWLNGSKVADDYEDFYDQSWDDEANPRNRAGAVVTADQVWTGSHYDGQRSHSAPTVSAGLGTSLVRLGRLNHDSSSPLHSLSGNAPIINYPYYALSGVFVVAGVTITPTSLTVDEGDTADYMVELDAQPTADVTINITGGGDVSVSPTTLTFSPTTWDTAQTVTVTAAQDSDAADDTQTVSHAVDADSAAEYLGASLDGLTVTVDDDERLGIRLTPTTLTVNEGSTADYTVELRVQPTADVTVNITGGGDVTVNPTSLTFTSATWDTAQTVTVTAAQDDDAADDTQTVSHAVDADSAAEYLGASLDGLTVTVNDSAREVTVPADWALIPTGLTGGDKFRLLFLTASGHSPTSANIADYNTYVQGRAAGGHADIQDYSYWFRVLGSTEDTDANENTRTTYTDDDKGVRIYWLNGSKVADDYEDFYDGDWEDEANPRDRDGATVSPGRVWTGSFTGGFDLPGFSFGQSLVATGQLNSDSVGPVFALVAFTPDANYPYYALSGVFVVAGVTITPTSLTVDEGDTADYMVELDAQPTADVTVNITGGGDVSVSPTTLTFTTTTWDTAQTVTVTAAQDDDAADDTLTVGHAVDAGSAAEYVGATLDGVAVTVTDDESLALVKNTGQDALTVIGAVLTGVVPTHAQAFTTGSNARGYTLGSIGFDFFAIGATSTAGSHLTVSLNEVANGLPGDALCSLSDPASFSASGVHTFSAPTTDPCPTLAPGTSYFAVIERVASTSGTISLKITVDDDEDAGGAAGWSIGNSAHFQEQGEPWETDNASRMIEVRGAVNPATGNPATGEPTISGTLHVNETLTADTSGIADDDGTASATFIYQWVRVDDIVQANISEAANSTYMLTDDDEGKQIKVRVSFSDDLGNPEGPLSSQLTDAVHRPATGAPTISGTPRVGKALTASISDISDPEGTVFVDFTYQWVRVDGAVETDISGATSSTYTLTPEDADKQVKVQVSFTDDGGGAEGPLASLPTEAVVPADVLVRNTRNPAVTAAELSSTSSGYGQRFTTGSYGAGYTLSSIRVPLTEIGDTSTVGSELTVTLNADDNGNPGAVLCTLTDPESFSASGLHAFAVPTTGTPCPLLEPSTTYFVVLERANGNTDAIKWGSTPTLGQDSGSAEGWSIEDRGHIYTTASSAWAQVAMSANLLIEVKGGVATEVTVPSDWALIPPGLTGGDRFRLLFLTPTGHSPTSANIADYNNYVQGVAAAGHTDIQSYSYWFRVLGSTAGTDARDNTGTTYTSSEKGVPIYWLNGSKVADDYENFYDGAWDDEANPKGNSGATITVDDVWTGSESDGTEAFLGAMSRAFAASVVRVGRLNHGTAGPLHSTEAFTGDTNYPYYALSGVFVVGPGLTVTPTTLTVAEGSTADYTVKLSVQPTAAVTVNITGGGDVTVSPTSLTFSPTTWDTAQTVTVTAAQDDDAADDTQTVSHAVDADSAAEYVGATLDGLPVTVDDDESLGITLSPTTLTVAEGSTADYTVQLSVQPTADVTINITGGGDVSVSPTSLTFTTTTWDTAQTVTVTAAQDDDAADDTQTVSHTVDADSAAEYLGASLDGLTVTVNDSATEVTVPADWGLIPTGLTGGDRFRLLFLTSTANPTSADIADYNTYVQGRAAGGHADIQDYSYWFRVVGSTEDTDARDNTETTYTDDDKGVPIYWLNGTKIADDYENFYDGAWDDEENPRDRAGGTVTAAFI